ncbi:hypothetical protein ACN3XK_31510 [Actinomadura welshii]
MYKTHEMRMVRTDASGFEEWDCPTCGRRIMLRWPPAYEKRILDPGDETACHTGSAADTPATDAPCPARRLRETGATAAPFPP